MGRTPPFAQQRVLFFALPMGVIAFAIAIAVLHGDPELAKAFAGGAGDALADLAWPVAAGALLGGFALRRGLQARAERLAGGARLRARFHATLVPLAVFEGGALFGLVGFLLSGKEQPGLIAALVLLAAMLAIVPLRDPDEGAR